MLFNFWLKNGLNQFFLATWILLPGLIGGEKVGLGVELAPGNVSGVPLSSSSPPLLSLSKDRRALTDSLLSNSVSPDEADEFKECDRVFVSVVGGPTNGTFEAPKVDGTSVQCVYTFVPRPGERVQVTFTSFDVRGIPPECAHEWVDMYTEVDGTDVSELISTPFAGRYCGHIPPRTRISLYGGIAIGFYSDKNSSEEGDNIRFQGIYTFIKEERYVMGTPVPRTLCSFSILGTSKRSGELLSPTYPGVYPKDLSCSYKFIGTPGQRIRIEFRDFDIFAGGAHCPFDDVKVYDGLESTAPIIGTYCGQYRNLVVYSSQHLLLLNFTTNERTLETQNRGFLAVWEFSESFVKLDFITKNAGEHIRGTECDQRILSQGKGSTNSSGAVYSPNYPFPYLPKIYCRYFIYGVQDPQNLERVRISFHKFDVPSTTHSEEEVTTSLQATEKQPNRCGDGYLKIYVKGQELTQSYDKHDYEFCGKEVPHEVASDGPRVVLIFSSGETQGSGFKANYAFETEYRVPGTPAPDGTCAFSYSSGSDKRGEFNSPRFPSNYPSDLNCVYVFHAEESHEQVRIVFDHFKVRSDLPVNHTGGAYGEDLCSQDWVEIYNVFKGRPDRLIGRYCNQTGPGPVESHEEADAVKIVLHTDHEGVFSGFKARYMFFTATSIFGECGQNFSQKDTGILTSPGWPNKYEPPRNKEGSNRCNWFLAVRPGHRVFMYFNKFTIEGDPGTRGCPSAAVRLWVDPDGLPQELCGETLLASQLQFVSVKNVMRVTFITAHKAVGNEGFYATWTEVQERFSLASSCPPNYIKCEKNPHCVPEKLKCDGINNCGLIVRNCTPPCAPDTSDEDLCGLDTEINLVMVIGIGSAFSSFCLLSLCAWSHRKRRKRRRRMQLRRPPIHVCDNAGARFAAMDNV